MDFRLLQIQLGLDRRSIASHRMLFDQKTGMKISVPNQVSLTGRRKNDVDEWKEPTRKS